MATTAIWDVRGWLGQVVHYVENPDKTAEPAFSEQDVQGLRDVMNYALQDYKTEQQYYVTGIHCRPETARQEMLLTKKQFQKEGSIVAFHGYQSFAPGEVTPQLAHEIGVNLAKKLWGDRFQVLVATHLDKAHLHNHFVLNSVSFIDGKRYNDCNETYLLMRRTSDELCKEYGLSIIENPQRGKRRSYDAWQAERDGKPTWHSIIREDIDVSIKGSLTFQHFVRHMKSRGYNLERRGQTLRLRPQGKDRFVRFSTLGEQYSEETIIARIMRQQRRENPPEPQPPTVKKICVQGDFRLSKITFRGLRALYFHYLHLLRKARYQPSITIPAILRDDLRKLDALSRQTVLLMKNKIETPEQLAAFITDKDSEMERLCAERTELNNHIRRITPDEAEELRARRTDLTAQITELRKQRKIAIGVVEYAEEVHAKLEAVKRKETEKGEGKRAILSRQDGTYSRKAINAMVCLDNIPHLQNNKAASFTPPYCFKKKHIPLV